MQYNKIDIVTLGCKVNSAESGEIARQLESYGCEVHHGLSGAPLAVVNTCAVTSNAASESRKLIRRVRKGNPQAHVIVCGCVGGLDKESIQAIDGVVAVFGPARNQEVVAHVLQDVQLPLKPVVAVSHGRSRPELKIQDGCNCRCSYCVIPFARGNSRSANPKDVVQTAVEIEQQGYREVVLTGIHVGHYGMDLQPKTNLAELVDAILQATSHVRIRLSSIEPQEVTPPLIALWSKWYGRLCPHLHVPLQSGSDTMLKVMNRPYTTAKYQAVLASIVDSIDSVCLGSDIIVGHPGETAALFDETYNFISNLPLQYLHVFTFSPRERTAAVNMPDRPIGQEVAERMKACKSLDLTLRTRYAQKLIGKKVGMVPEKIQNGMVSGMCEFYQKVSVPWNKDFPRQVVPVTMEKFTIHNGLVSFTGVASY